MCITANGILLENKGATDLVKFHWPSFDDVLVGGKFYSDAIITHLRPIQDAYNRYKTTYRMVKALLTGKMIAAREHTCSRIL